VLDQGHKEHTKVRLQAASDFADGKARSTFPSEEEKKHYTDAWETLLREQRLLSCLTAQLGGATGTTPIQLRSLPASIHNKLGTLNVALERNSRKIPKLFREVEATLLEALPKGFEEHLAADHTPVVFFSDLPMEWTLVGEFPLCLTRPVSRIPMGLATWDVLTAALEHPVIIDITKPEQVLVLDFIGKGDVIRAYSDTFRDVSDRIGQRYTYSRPRTQLELAAVLRDVKPTVVILDTHGAYDASKDELSLEIAGHAVKLDDLLPDVRVPPVWVLSACDTSVTGAIRGCFVRKLLSRGAVCVIASLSRIDAFTASMFVGRFFAHIYSPVKADLSDSLDRVFFEAQYTTALLYDPLLPLIRRAESDPNLRKLLGNVMSDFMQWAGVRELDVRRHKYEIAVFLAEALERYGLTQLQEQYEKAGLIRPETLLFTAFGAPGHVRLEGRSIQ
jgi:hypothetical protein